MMQDYIRTGTYQRAILSNGADFLGKVKQPFSHSLFLIRLFTDLTGLCQTSVCGDDLSVCWPCHLPICPSSVRLCLFVCLFVCSFIHSFIHSSIYVFFHSFARSFVHPSVRPSVLVSVALSRPSVSPSVHHVPAEHGGRQ